MYTVIHGNMQYTIRNILSGVDGMVHIPQLSNERGRLSLSIKAIDEQAADHL